MSMVSKLEVKTGNHASQLENLCKAVPAQAGHIDALQARVDKAEAALAQQASAIAMAKAAQESAAQKGASTSQEAVARLEVAVSSAKAEMDARLVNLTKQLAVLQDQVR